MSTKSSREPSGKKSSPRSGSVAFKQLTPTIKRGNRVSIKVFLKNVLFRDQLLFGNAISETVGDIMTKSIVVKINRVNIELYLVSNGFGWIMLQTVTLMPTSFSKSWGGCRNNI